jgi:tight adherence protein C
MLPEPPMPDLHTALAAGGAALLLVIGVLLLLGREARRHELALRMRLQLRGAPTTAASRGGAQVSRDSNGGAMPLRLLHAVGEALKGRALFSERELGDLGRSLAAAGYDPRRAVPVMLGAKALLLFLMPAAGYGVVVLRGGQDMVVTLAISAVLGLLGPNWAVGFLRRSYANALRRGLPDALDLLVVCAEAGLGLDTAVDRVAREMGSSNSATGQEFATLAHELRVLPERRQALDRLAERSGLEGFRRLAGTLSQTLRYGTPLSQALRVLSAEMRQERMLRFEERAARLPALLVLPLILFVMPCLFIVLIGPSVVVLSERFGG